MIGSNYPGGPYPGQGYAFAQARNAGSAVFGVGSATSTGTILFTPVEAGGWWARRKKKKAEAVSRRRVTVHGYARAEWPMARTNATGVVTPVRQVLGTGHAAFGSFSAASGHVRLHTHGRAGYTQTAALGEGRVRIVGRGRTMFATGESGYDHPAFKRQLEAEDRMFFGVAA